MTNDPIDPQTLVDVQTPPPPDPDVVKRIEEVMSSAVKVEGR